jgi:hypothetical protein
VLNSFTFTPPVDAIQEFRIQTANAEAGQGRNSGAQVSVALKRGGNQLHGAVYEFLRNERLDARNFFDLPEQPQPKLRRNQFGFAVGGPLRKGSTFFFADYEGLRERRGMTQLSNVPTLAERNGDFSGSALARADRLHDRAAVPQRPAAVRPSHRAGGRRPLPAAQSRRPGTEFRLLAHAWTTTQTSLISASTRRSGETATLAGRYSFADRGRFEPFAGGQFRHRARLRQ